MLIHRACFPLGITFLKLQQRNGNHDIDGATVRIWLWQYRPRRIHNLQKWWENFAPVSKLFQTDKDEDLEKMKKKCFQMDEDERLEK